MERQQEEERQDAPPIPEAEAIPTTEAATWLPEWSKSLSPFLAISDKRYLLDISQWGKALWRGIVAMAMTFPENPTVEDREHYRKLVEALSHTLPCHECQRHMREFMLAHPPNLESTRKFVEWCLALFNDVRTRQGKPLVSLEMLAASFGDPELVRKILQLSTEEMQLVHDLDQRLNDEHDAKFALPPPPPPSSPPTEERSTPAAPSLVPASLASSSPVPSDSLAVPPTSAFVATEALCAWELARLRQTLWTEGTFAVVFWIVFALAVLFVILFFCCLFGAIPPIAAVRLKPQLHWQGEDRGGRRFV